MNKVDIMLACMQAAMTYGNDPRCNAIYALCAVNRNTLQWICQNQSDNGDVMASDAIRFALGLSVKPSWMSQAGL